jgi:hypothetical protein
MILESGLGNGKLAGVDGDNRLLTASFNIPFQHLIAKDYQKTFQVWGEATLANGTVTPIHIKNNSSDRVYVVTYIRWQVVDQAGGTALPNASNYWQLGFGPTYVSGGTSVTPVNMSSGSNAISSLVAYQANPTLNGSLTVCDKHYAKAEADMNTYNKEGAMLLLPGSTMAAQYVGDHTSGTIYTRISLAEVSASDYSG